MKLVKEFPNLKLDRMCIHPIFDIIAAVGFRTCILMNSSLEVIQKHIDSNKEEMFFCCAFADIKMNFEYKFQTLDSSRLQQTIFNSKNITNF